MPWNMMSAMDETTADQVAETDRIKVWFRFVSREDGSVHARSDNRCSSNRTASRLITVRGRLSDSQGYPLQASAGAQMERLGRYKTPITKAAEPPKLQHHDDITG